MNIIETRTYRDHAGQIRCLRCDAFEHERCGCHPEPGEKSYLDGFVYGVASVTDYDPAAMAAYGPACLDGYIAGVTALRAARVESGRRIRAARETEAPGAE